MVREQRFQAKARPITIGEYSGKIYDTPVGTTMWMAVHFALGRPPFIKDFQMVDEYGLKSSLVDALFKDKARVPVYRLVFKSQEDAINALDLVPVEAGKESAPEAGHPPDRPGFRNKHAGIYTDGTYWAAYRRSENVLVLGAGDIPREDLERILDTILSEVR
jgi:hypothetical protein